MNAFVKQKYSYDPNVFKNDQYKITLNCLKKKDVSNDSLVRFYALFQVTMLTIYFVLQNISSAYRAILFLTKFKSSGYACLSIDGVGVRKVRTVVTAGDAPNTPLSSGECARINTGAALPAGADCVVQVRFYHFWNFLSRSSQPNLCRLGIYNVSIIKIYHFSSSFGSISHRMFFNVINFIKYTLVTDWCHFKVTVRSFYCFYCFAFRNFYL